MEDESRMNSDDPPTRADVEAMRAWDGLGNFDPLLGDERVHEAYGDGRIVIQAPGLEAAREVEETARAHEERHRESRAGLMHAMGEALARGYTVSPGPWALRNCATEKGREELRRAGFEERHDGKLGTVWVRPADGEVLKPRESGFVAPPEEDAGRGRSG